MLIKSFTVLQAFARQKEESEVKPITRNQWINADRIVMIVLFLSVILGAVLFS